MSRFAELERAVLARNGRRSGDEIWFSCLFPDNHKNRDARPSASFNSTKGTWYCLVCSKGGGAKDLSGLLGLSSNSSREIAATYPYTDEQGQLLFEVVRYANPKDFRQRRPDNSGGWIWTTKGVRRVLYRLPEVIEGVRAGRAIHLVEGEKDADSLGQLGMVATTNPGGAGKWRTDYSQVLRGARVVILPDNDQAGSDHAQLLARNLHRIATEIRIVSLPDLPAGGDVSDWIAARTAPKSNSPEETRHELERLVEATPPWEPSSEAPPEEEKGRPNQSQIILGIAEASGAELFHDASDVAFLYIPMGGHHEVWPVRSRSARNWLIQGYYRATGKAPSRQPLQDAMNALEARARFDGECRNVFTRIASEGSAVYLDLCNDSWEVVEITASRWRVLPQSPVRFRRMPHMRALPAPLGGGSLLELHPLVNLPDERAFVLLVAFLVAALGPSGPYPLLVLNGEQGSAKSTLARLVAALIDPTAAPLLTLPRSERDLAIMASHRRLLLFDNLSGLSPWFSDALCRLSTGGGFSTRALHTDSDEIVFNAMLPVVLNGIDEVIGRQDLVDRSLVLQLAAIAEEMRRPEREIEAEFEAARPRLLGALLDAVSCGLRRRDQVRLERMPRMADFAHWIVAAEPALPWAEGTFLAAYEDNLLGAVEVSLESDDVAASLRELAPFEGTTTDLLEALNAGVPDALQRSRSWPKTSQALSSRVRRAAPSLRRLGVEVVTGEREPGTGRRLVRLVETTAARDRHSRHGRHEPADGGAFPRDDDRGTVTSTGGDRHGESPTIPGLCDDRDECDDLIPSDSQPIDEELVRL